MFSEQLQVCWISAKHFIKHPASNTFHCPLNSRFIHRTVDDEEFYRQCGSFPVQPEPVQTNALSTAPPNVIPNHPPQYPSNHQQHISPPISYYRDDSVPVHQSPPPQSYVTQSVPPPNMQMATNSRRRSYGMVSGPPDVIPSKRPHMDESFVTYNQQSVAVQHLNGGQHRPLAYEQQPAPVIAAPSTNAAPTIPQATMTSVVIGEDVINIYRLYEEHNLLRRRVEINEERLHELRATNTYLLHQNEQLRRQSQCSCTSTIVNPVTLTTTSQQQSAQVSLNIWLFLLHFLTKFRQK